ncbi:MAG: hypothetical protein AAB517_00470 [Patescibacteria group bacterium]
MDDARQNAMIGTQIPLFAEHEAVPQPEPATTPEVEVITVSEPSPDAQPDMFNVEYFK